MVLTVITSLLLATLAHGLLWLAADQPSEAMSDSSLSFVYLDNRDSLDRFARTFMKEERIHDVELITRWRFALDDGLVLADEREIGRIQLPIDDETMVGYLTVLRRTGFFRAQVLSSPGVKSRFLVMTGDSSSGAFYGLLFSPEGMSPKVLLPSVYRYRQIMDGWYTFRAKGGMNGEDG